MRIRSRLTAGVVAVACTAAVTVAAVGPTASADSIAGPAGMSITKRGIGPVKLGKRHSKLRKQGLVGKKVPGCELGGPGLKSARLKAPLTGGVDYRRTKPSRVKNVVITDGPAEARGVGIGDRKRDIKAAYGKVKVERGTEEVFGITLVSIPKKRGGKIAFAVDVDSKRISAIGVPGLAFCE